jgi:Tfp pilus assembly protein PilN
VPSLETAFTQKIADKKLKVQGFMVMSTLFILLLANFVLFSWLNSSNAQLSEQASRTAQSTTDIQGINESIKQKEGMLHILGWEEGINKSALIDQVAALLPPEISWKEVAVDPIDLNTTRAQKSLAFYNRQIRITGNSEKIIPVNEWIARVKTKPWVKNIQLENYTYNSELNTGQFTITITY